jgi:hypothetical protein
MSINYINPNQIPVIAADQPLFALAKQIQWTYPDLYGEDKYFFFLGDLHIEQVIYAILESYFEDSGWLDLLGRANITIHGVAKIKRSRNAHHITAAVLHIKLKDAYTTYLSETDEPLLFADWCSAQCEEVPQFLYWYKGLQLELIAFTFLHAVRTGNFPLYKEAITEVIPLCFMFNHTHYARWLSVHLHDLLSLPDLQSLIKDSLVFRYSA